MASSAILHFKGSARVLEDIPSKIVVTPGRYQRIIVAAPQADRDSAVTTKDVEVVLAPGHEYSEFDEWTTSITFAPDERSDGLTVDVRARPFRVLAVAPKSVILTDNPDGSEADIKLSTDDAGQLFIDSVETNLPLTWSLLPHASPIEDTQTIRLGVRGSITSNVSGTLRVRGHTKLIASKIVSIPVVIVHQNTGHS
jgi:hypothetical protein